MSGLFLTLSFICGLAFFIGLIKPSAVVRWSKPASRKQVFLFYFLPSIAFFIAFGSVYENSLETALKDPLNATAISLRDKHLTVIPSEALTLVNLTELDLSKNDFTSIPEHIKTFQKLERLILSDNPIDTIPNWLFEMENLSIVDLNNTKIQQLPTTKSLSISYNGTPLWKKENPLDIGGIKNENPTSATEEDHDESLGEYAIRSLLYEDYGQKRKFGKGEVYYDSPVTKEEADAIGDIMTLAGLFTDQKEVSILLDKNTDEQDSTLYIVKIVVTDVDDIDEETLNFFKELRAVMSESALDGQTLHMHFTNGNFETQQVLTPND